MVLVLSNHLYDLPFDLEAWSIEFSTNKITLLIL